MLFPAAESPVSQIVPAAPDDSAGYFRAPGRGWGQLLTASLTQACLTIRPAHHRVVQSQVSPIWHRVLRRGLLRRKPRLEIIARHADARTVRDLELADLVQRPLVKLHCTATHNAVSGGRGWWHHRHLPAIGRPRQAGNESETSALISLPIARISSRCLSAAGSSSTHCRRRVLPVTPSAGDPITSSACSSPAE